MPSNYGLIRVKLKKNGKKYRALEKKLNKIYMI